MENRREHILVADDESVTRNLIRDYLEALGHDVTCAKDGREAIAALEATDFDRVFLDVMMPYVDGYSVLKWIRTHPTNLHMPVALMTAMAEYGSNEDPLTRWVDKPIIVEDLLWDLATDYTDVHR